MTNGLMAHQALGGIKMKNKTIVAVTMVFAIFTLGVRCEDYIDPIRLSLNAVIEQVPERKLEGIVYEALNFESFGKYQSYRNLSSSVSNDWRGVLYRINNIAANKSERLLLLGVGKQFDEDFYIDFLTELCVLQTNNIITARELDWASASTRYDLDSCLIRRYKEPKVISLVNSMKKIFPQQRFWDKVLSGERYTNYLHEAAAGQWGPNPPGITQQSTP
jgi:hypothetical protein